MGNSIEMAVADLGVQAAGGQVAPLNLNLTDRELTPLFGDIDPPVVLCSPEHAERMTALARQLGDAHVEIVGDGGVDVWTLADDAAWSVARSTASARRSLLVVLHWGHHGVSQGRRAHAPNDDGLLPHQPVGLAIRLRPGGDPQRRPDVPHLGTSLQHRAAPLPRSNGVVARQYRPELVLDLLERHHVTLFAGGPASIYVGLVESPRIDEVDLSSLRFSLPAAPRSRGAARAMAAIAGHAILEGWGMSEGAPINANPELRTTEAAVDRDRRSPRPRSTSSTSRPARPGAPGRAARRDPGARTPVHRRLPEPTGETPPRSATAGSTPATSATSTTTDTCSSSTARRS